MTRTPMGSLSACMLRVGARKPLTKPMALAPGQAPVSANADRIQTLIAEAREEIGYHRPGFIRVEHPDQTVPGTRLGRYRERVPVLENHED